MTIEGDCFELIKELDDNSVDLIITSPPYSNIVNYGKEVSIKKPDDYCDWLLPLFSEIYRVLKPTGSFILNINDKVEKGYRSTFVYDLISRNNKETKLKLYDTYIWHKKAGIPNGGPRRFRNLTEYIFHFCKDNKQMKFYMDRVLEASTDSSKDRYKYKSTGNGIVIDGKRIKEMVYRTYSDKVRPDNVFRFRTAGTSRDNKIKHPAPFHKEIPLYFINLLTDIGDIVLDPFAGIGTTGLAVKELNREYLGYELNKEYVEYSTKRIDGDDLHFKKVAQYDLDGNLLKTYNTYGHAANETGLRIHDILRCIRTPDGHKTHGGFIWKLE